MKNTLRVATLIVTLSLPCLAADEIVPVPGRQTAMNVGVARSFTITLPANPTTGYDWQLLAGHDETILAFAGRKNVVPPSARRLSGAPLREQWSFKAKKKGATTLLLVYKRSWEAEVISTMTYTVTVQ
jgi:inhibitor of cysteine peptidase